MTNDHTQKPPQLRHSLQCPQCSCHTGKADVEYSGQERDEIPEGLAGVTLAQCTECGHEWELVTHKQILHSLRTWTSFTPNPQ